MMKPDIFKMPKDELELMLKGKYAAMFEEQREQGVEPCFGDEIGVFILKPDGSKEYIEMYDNAHFIQPYKTDEEICATEMLAETNVYVKDVIMGE